MNIFTSDSGKQDGLILIIDLVCLFYSMKMNTNY
jgi:hypothetical protein